MAVNSVFVDIDCPVFSGSRFKTIWQATPREYLSDFKESYYDLDALGINLNTKFYIKKCKNCSLVLVNSRL